MHSSGMWCICVGVHPPSPFADICLGFMFIKGIAFIQAAGRLAFTNYIKFVYVYMQDSGDKRLLLSKLSSFAT